MDIDQERELQRARERERENERERGRNIKRTGLSHDNTYKMTGRTLWVELIRDDKGAVKTAPALSRIWAVELTSNDEGAVKTAPMHCGCKAWQAQTRVVFEPPYVSYTVTSVAQCIVECVCLFRQLVHNVLYVFRI